jgi:hypothetical protein
VLREQGIATFAQLGALDEKARADLREVFDGLPFVDLDGWIESARELASEYAAAEVTEDGVSAAQAYLQEMKRRRGRPIDRNGVSETIVRVDGGPAVPSRFDAFDAPANHPAIGDFVSALKAFVAATDGPARIPDLDAYHVRMLEAVYESMGDG